MERDIDQSARPTLCRGGCGFYGSSATEGLCSKCFKDTLKRKQDPGPGRISPTTSTTPKGGENVVSHAAAASSAAAVTAAIENLVAPMQTTCCSTAVSGGVSSMTAASLLESEGLPSIGESVTPSSSSTGNSEAENGETEAVAAPSTSGPPKQKNRCDQCRKRVGLTGFECRCGGLFCAIHRYSDMHQCSFDYKALGEKEIRKNNPVVKTEKIQKL